MKKLVKVILAYEDESGQKKVKELTAKEIEELDLALTIAKSFSSMIREFLEPHC